MLKKSDVYDQLRTVIDPELHIDIVSLGLIYDVEVSKKNGKKVIYVVMTLTTPGCPLAGVINKMIKEAVALIEGVEEEDVALELTFDPPWVVDMMSEEARLELGMI